MDKEQLVNGMVHSDMKWDLLPKEKQLKYVQLLEETAAHLLDQWVELDEKIHHLNEKLKLAEELPAYSSKGTTYYSLNMFIEAAEQLANEEANGYEDDIRRLYLGYSYYFIGLIDQAQEVFIYLVQSSDHTHIKHFSYLGQAHIALTMKKFDEAIGKFERANSLISSLDVVYNLSLCYFYMKQYTLAKEYALSYIEMNNNEEGMYFVLGCCDSLLGNYERSLSYWSECLQINPSLQMLIALSIVYEWHGLHYAAIHCLELAQKREEYTFQVYHGLAWNYALIGDIQQSRKFFHYLLKKEDDDKEIRRSINWLSKAFPEFNVQWLNR
ncbi:tetratricopeptide repeat protein [Halalkalibacter sp. AB-rgal2]|uniref:tetratricopeptide repeat protein n=1 Tax=Halalkalibacter sp. AB-rgal2 TaxID=3242695 RepID=UPI00359D06C5